MKRADTIAYRITLQGLINDDVVIEKITKYMRKFRYNAVIRQANGILSFERIELVGKPAGSTAR